MPATIRRLAGALLILSVSVTAQAGYMVVNNDEWTLSNTGFSNSPDAGVFINNITNLFTGDVSGSFLAYSNNFGLTQSALASAVTGAGHSWTVSTAVPFTLATLNSYDGIFLAGPVGAYPDTTVIRDYLLGGGNVYIAAGTGLGGAAAEAAAWNPVLAEAGLAFTPSYNGISGNAAPVGPHPLLAGVSSLYFNNGNSVIDLAPGDSTGEILFSLGGQGMLALGSFGDLPPPSVFSPGDVPEPSSWLLAAIGLLVSSWPRARRAIVPAR